MPPPPLFTLPWMLKHNVLPSNSLSVPNVQISADFVRVEVQGSVTTNDAREVGHLCWITREGRLVFEIFTLLHCAALHCTPLPDGMGNALLRCSVHLQDLLELMRTILACRLGQLSLVRGDSTRHKKLLVSNMTPEQVFDKLRATLQK
jgi:hypothetical protein